MDAALAHAQSGGAREKIVFGDKDFSGNPILLRARQLRLRSQATRMLHNVTVRGGWQRGDEAILMVEGVNGSGWTERDEAHSDLGAAAVAPGRGARQRTDASIRCCPLASPICVLCAERRIRLQENPMHRPGRRLALLIGLSLSLGACSSSPEQLAADLQQAFEGGDMDAALKLGMFGDAPAQLHFFYLHQVGECASAGTICTVSLQPLDDDYRKRLADQAAEGVEVAVAPAGIVVIESKGTDGKSSGKLRMPYAQVDGRYLVIAQRYSAAKLEELRSTSNGSLLERALEKGTFDPANGEPRPDWRLTATELPAGGGEPGAAFVQYSDKLAAAAQAGDPEAASLAEGGAANWYSDKDWSGQPVDLATRKHTLRAHAARFKHQVEVTGGWAREDSAVLTFNARDGVGWIERGAVVMNHGDQGWERGVEFTVSYPAP